MSLSFVSSAVQSKTEGGDYEETPINQSEVEAVNKRNANKPLFEQLRDNEEEEQAKRDELQREIMRGTRALDEDDVAHLEALNKQQLERERAIQEQTQSELAMFRAAKAMRQQAALGDDGDDSVDDNNPEEGDARGSDKLVKATCATAAAPTVTAVKPKAPVVPKIKVKKRKRKGEADTVNKKVEAKSDGDDDNNDVGQIVGKEGTANKPSPVGLSGLLSGYGSSSDEA